MNEIELTSFYERWVNGNRVSTLQLLQRPAGTGAPVVPPREPASHPIEIRLGSYRSGDSVLRRLDERALGPVEHVLVHGSQATRDACDFSDIDILVILDDTRRHSAAEHRAAIAELRRLLRAIYAYDPLMHHGLMFLPARALAAYDESYLPLETLRCAQTLYGANKLTIAPVAAGWEEVRSSLRDAITSLRRRFALRSFTDDYRSKQVLAGFLLLPARIAALHGHFVYKRDSFAIARELFSANAWTAMARAEEFRLNWVRPRRDPLAQMLGFVHPAACIRQSMRRPPTRNTRALLAGNIERWSSEVQRLLDRAEELAA